ncbi:MAG: tripartite tricarboxylate transporter permease [Candidatus Aenigmatarchaeota archaeon]
MLEFIIFSLLGLFLGTILGLIPGMHINNILPLIMGLSFIIDPMNLAIFIVSISISQIFIGYIPSIFLGAPEENTALSVLPGHKLLLAGKGFEAIKLTVISGIFALFFSISTIFILTNYFSYLYELSRPYVHYILIFLISIMLIYEKNFKMSILSLAIILLSGIFGILVLNSTIITTKFVLFPVLSGLFGISTLLISLFQNSKIPPQSYDDEIDLPLSTFLKSIFLGSLSGLAVGFLPAVGVSQAATLMQYIGKMQEARSFLATLSSINISNEIFSLISLFFVGNPRSGASVAIERILGKLNFHDTLILIGTICFTSSMAALLTIFLGKIIPKFLIKINYKILSLIIILFLLSMISISTGLNGLLIVFTATSIGFLCNLLGVRRSHCMGVLLIPSIFFFAGLNPTIISILGL